MTTPRSGTPLASPEDGNHHHRSYFRQILTAWTPDSNDEAKAVLEETLGRAESLSRVFALYCWGSDVSSGDLKFPLELLDDLLYLSYAMLEYWRDDDELIKAGWTPPSGKGVQP